MTRLISRCLLAFAVVAMLTALAGCKEQRQSVLVIPAGYTLAHFTDDGAGSCTNQVWTHPYKPTLIMNVTHRGEIVNQYLVTKEAE